MIRSVVSRISQVNKREEGASAVEFAIIAPVLILLVFGIIYFGLILNNYLVLTHAAREAVRHASLHETGAQTMTAVQNATASLDQSKLKVTIDPPDPSVDGLDGTTATISLEYPFQVELPVIKQILELSPSWDSGMNSLWLKTQAKMRIE